MAEKYVPSGYQIIDLGEIGDLSDLRILTKSSSADAKTLIDIFKNGKIYQKPLFIHLVSEDMGLELLFNGYIMNNNIQHTVFADDGTALDNLVIVYNSETENIGIQLVPLSLGE